MLERADVAAPSREAILSAWTEADARCAVLRADRAVITEMASVRAHVVELVTSGAEDDEIFDACAVLGRLVARRHGSPTLAASMIDHAAEALSASGAAWVAPARATVVEAFSADLVAQGVDDAVRTWEFPHCVVPLGGGSIAVAGGYPGDDEAVAAWAARVAQSAALDGVRQATIAGPEPTRRALAEAFAVVGVRVVGR